MFVTAKNILTRQSTKILFCLLNPSNGNTWRHSRKFSSFASANKICMDNVNRCEIFKHLLNASTYCKLLSTQPHRAAPAACNMEYSNHHLASHLGQDLLVINDFISLEEESQIMEEINPYLARLRYEYDHWDDAIHGFRETERKSWNESNTKIIERIRCAAFGAQSGLMSLVHVLDLEEQGYIKPHVDSVRFCGDTIAGVSLLTDAVMRLVSTTDSSLWVNALLTRRSLYIIRNKARYDFTHALLARNESYFQSTLIPKGRRVSIICRNEPQTASA